MAAPYRQSIYCLGPAQKQRKMLRISGLVIAAHGMIFGENCTRFSYKLRELGGRLPVILQALQITDFMSKGSTILFPSE